MFSIEMLGFEVQRVFTRKGRWQSSVFDVTKKLTPWQYITYLPTSNRKNIWNLQQPNMTLITLNLITLKQIAKAAFKFLLLKKPSSFNQIVLHLIHSKHPYTLLHALFPLVNFPVKVCWTCLSSPFVWKDLNIDTLISSCLKRDFYPSSLIKFVIRNSNTTLAN